MTRNVKIVLGLVILVVLVGLFGGSLSTLLFYPGGAFAAHDSPVTIAGGSIHGEVGPLNYWKPVVQGGRSYSAQSNNSDQISATGYSPAIPALTKTGGWVITFSNTNLDNSTSNPNSISFCSDSSCDSNMGPGNVVYLQANGEALWEEKLVSRSLHFHDVRHGCDENYPKDKSEGDCDHISYVIVATTTNVPNTKGIQYKCPDQKKCLITVGR